MGWFDALKKSFRRGGDAVPREGSEEDAQHYQEMKSLYERDSGRGNVGAMINLAALHLKGLHGDPIDSKSAIKLLEQAIDLKKDSHEAMLMLANIYHVGLGDETINERKAERYYQMANSLGNFEAKMALANIYSNGHGAEMPDRSLAIKLYEEAIKQPNQRNSAEAMTRLAVILYTGKKEERIRAIGLFEKASDLKNTEAMKNLATLYHERGAELLEHTTKSAPSMIVSDHAFFEEKYLAMASDLGDIEAIRRLADLTHNEKQQMALYDKASNSGDIESMIKLAGLIKAKYQGHIAYEKKARQLYEKAILHSNSVVAINELADLLYRPGISSAEDFSKAVALYEAAIQLNSTDAPVNLARLLEGVMGRNPNAPHAEKIIALYALASDANYLKDGESAALHLAKIYTTGLGEIKVDLEKAILYADRAKTLAIELEKKQAPGSHFMLERAQLFLDKYVPQALQKKAENSAKDLSDLATKGQQQVEVQRSEVVNPAENAVEQKAVELKQP